MSLGVIHDKIKKYVAYLKKDTYCGTEGYANAMRDTLNTLNL